MGLENQKAWRNDAYAKVTGQARYTDDYKMHGQLYAAPVYTEYVHARIRSFDTSDASNAAGVVKVITAKDIPGTHRFGQIRQDYRLLCDKTIRMHGDVVALVVAETRKDAEAAALLVKVDAEPLPILTDPELAMLPDAVQIHPEYENNITNHHKIRRGEVQSGFDSSDVIIEQEFQTQRIEHGYLEPEAALCFPRPDGVMEVMGSMQHPFSTRRFVAAILGVTLSEVEVRSVSMGGGFGGKDDTAAIVCARCALAAKLCGKPVKLIYKREWSMRESYKRHPYNVQYKMGLSKDGLIQAVKVRAVADAGAYCSVTPWVTWRSTVQCCGPYKVPNVHCDVFGVYTNNVFTGAMRGFGSPQMNYCVEQMIEMAAEKLGIGGIELRRKNMLHQGDVTITEQILDGHTVSLEPVMDKVLKAIDYDRKFTQCTFGKAQDGEDYGIGLAISYRGMSLGAEGKDFNGAVINVQFDGSILLEVAIHENGQGAESAMVLLLAEKLGVKRERIRYKQGSTSAIPDGGTTVASRGTLMGGGAVVHAAENLKKKMARVLADVLDCTPDQVRFEEDEIKGPNKVLSFEDAITQMFLKQEYPYAFGSFKAPRVSWEEEKGVGNAYFTWVYGCQAVELTVNRDTGKVTLLNAVAAHDAGKVVNPPMLLGQYYGGMAMGVGYALKEEVTSEEGRVTSLNFNRYHIPRSTDLPEMQGIIVENRDEQSPSGAKGIGEPVTELMAPAIANALYHATGRRQTTLPMRSKESRQ